MSFSHETMLNFGYYVYRLIDPRNGLTFYVENGKKIHFFNMFIQKVTQVTISYTLKISKKENLKTDLIFITQDQ